MSGRTWTIELLGAPAAGKTGLAAALVSAVPADVLKDHDRRDWPAVAATLARCWRSAWPPLRGPVPEGVRRTRWAAWTVRLSVAPAVVRRRRSAGGTGLILDQGPVYTLGRMAGVRRTAPGAAWWQARVADTATLLDVLVLLEADVDVLATRARERAKRHRSDAWDERSTRAYLTEEQRTCRRLAETLADRGVTVVRLDTGRTALADQVAAVLAAARADLPARGTG